VRTNTRRTTLVGLVILVLVNLAGFAPPARAAAEALLAVTPANAAAGAAISLDGADFAAGEALTFAVVTPFGQTLALNPVVGTPTTLLIGASASGTPLAADARGAFTATFPTAINYQEGTWTFIARGRTSGNEGRGSFALAAPRLAATALATPTAATPASTPATPSAAPSAAPAPTGTVAAPVPSAPAITPSAAPTAVATASAAPVAPSAAPATTPSVAPAPSSAATPAPATSTASPSPGASPAASASPAPSVAPAPSAVPVASPSPPGTAIPGTPSPAPTATPAPAPTAPIVLAPGIAVLVASPTGSAALRAQPTGSAPLVRALLNGTPLTITGASRGAEGQIWWPVQGDGVAGWLVAVVLVPGVAPPGSSPAPAPAPTAIGDGVAVVVNAPGGGANLRSQPSTTAAIVRVVASGTTLRVTGASRDAEGYVWWPVQGDGVAGWLVADVLTLAPNAAPSPGASPAPGLPGFSTPGTSPTPTGNGPGVQPPIDSPAVAPAQLMPIFERAAALTGVPKEILLAIARVESGFAPRAIGPFIPQLAGTENEHALGMMQFLPSTYRGYIQQVDAVTGKSLGIQGIWDAESAIYAAAFYLRDSGAPGDLRRALFAYNNAEWYVDLIISWANHYAAGIVTDPNFDPLRGGTPTYAAPQNPLLPSNGRHLDMVSPIQLYLPFTAGQTWYAGGDGSFYGGGFHTDQYSNYYTVDFNKGTWPRSEEDEGQPVLAAADGVVNNVYQDGAGAWVVELYHVAPDGAQLRTLYVHLQQDPRINPGIKTNQAVTHGTPIGLVGNTGNSTGAHLHFGLWLLQDGQWMSIRAEPLEGRFLQNGLSLTSSNVPTAPASGASALDLGFAPVGPSNADTVTIAVGSAAGAPAPSRIEVFANSARDGSERGQWLPVGAIGAAGAGGQVPWTTAPLAEGTYRLLFVLIDARGARTFRGLTADTAVRYTIRRGQPYGSVVVNPRGDLALLAPLDGAALARLGARGPVVSGPLRFAPVASQRQSAASISAGAALAATGSPTSGKVRDGQGLVVEEATTNLIPNPSFERGAEGWAVSGTPVGAFVVAPSDSALFGKRSLRLDNSKGTAPATVAVTVGDGGLVTWSIHARAVPPPVPSPARSPGTIGLAMSGVAAQEHALTAEWRRFALTGAAVGGSARAIVVPPGVVVEIDGAQLESKPYATSYADGSLGPGYGWDRAADASLSGRLPTVLMQPLDGLVTSERGAIAFWATPSGPTASGALLLTLGERLTLTLADETATLRWGAQILGDATWRANNTSHYALTWEAGTVTFLQDGQVVGQALLPDFALPADTPLLLGSDATGARAANATFQDLTLWREVPTPAALAALVGAGEFLRPGAAETVTLNVGLALATQGLAPNGVKMQFSFDGSAWTAIEPFAPTKTLALPGGAGEVRIYVRFTDDDGGTIVVTDRVQVVPPQPPTEGTGIGVE